MSEKIFIIIKHGYTEKFTFSFDILWKYLNNARNNKLSSPYKLSSQLPWEVKRRSKVYRLNISRFDHFVRQNAFGKLVIRK